MCVRLSYHRISFLSGSCNGLSLETKHDAATAGEVGDHFYIVYEGQVGPVMIAELQLHAFRL